MRMRLLVLALVAVAPVASARADFLNGNFETGNLAGWTTYTTVNGTLGPPGFPQVTSFDTTGSGATLAARFEVGQVSFQSGVQAGGGILQSLFFSSAGTFNLTARFASFNQNAANNAAAGLYSVLVDGVTVASQDLGSINSGQIIRSNFNLNLNLSAGNHEFRFQITRPFLDGAATPWQHYDNLSINGGASAVPAPSGVILAGLGATGFFGLRRRFFRKAAC